MATLTYKNMFYEIDGENFLVMLNAMIASTDLRPDVGKLEVDLKDPYIYSADLVHRWFTRMIKHFNVRVNCQTTEHGREFVRAATEEGQRFQNDFDRAYAIVRLGCELYPYLLMASVKSELKAIELPGALFLQFITVLDEVYEMRPRVRELLAVATAVLRQDDQRITLVNQLSAFPT